MRGGTDVHDCMVANVQPQRVARDSGGGAVLGLIRCMEDGEPTLGLGLGLRLGLGLGLGWG